MLKATLLGCAGSRPTINRALTAFSVQINGNTILIDCGEGTQVSLLKTGIKCYDIEVICLTHMHGDHTLGLPGLLSSIDQIVKNDNVLVDKKDIVLIAPASCKPLITSLRKMVSISKINLHCMWLTKDTETFEFEDFYINAHRVQHSVECYGYNVIEKGLPHFSKEMAEVSTLDNTSWAFLQKGYAIISNREYYSIEDIVSGNVYPAKVSYVTDTSPCPAICECIRDSNLAVLEGMYADASDLPKQITAEHLTFTDAATIAKEACVDKLWLTHFSQTLTSPEKGVDNIKSIFNDVTCGYQGLSIELSAVKD